jgi:hypothetical protein
MIRARTLPPTSLIPVLVTGIQPRRVRAVNDSPRVTTSPAPKDLGALDSCDKHWNEGSVEQRRAGRVAQDTAGRLEQRFDGTVDYSADGMVEQVLPTSLIPVLVTGIQPRRVRAVNDVSRLTTSPAPKDLGALDSGDEHRNEWRRDHRDAGKSKHRNERRVTQTVEQVARS